MPPCVGDHGRLVWGQPRLTSKPRKRGRPCARRCARCCFGGPRLRTVSGVRGSPPRYTWRWPLTNVFIQEIVRAFYYGWYDELVTALPPLWQGRIRTMRRGPRKWAPRLKPEIVRNRPDALVRRSARNETELNRRPAHPVGAELHTARDKVRDLQGVALDLGFECPASAVANDPLQRRRRHRPFRGSRARTTDHAVGGSPATSIAARDRHPRRDGPARPESLPGAACAPASWG